MFSNGGGPAVSTSDPSDGLTWPQCRPTDLVPSGVAGDHLDGHRPKPTLGSPNTLERRSTMYEPWNALEAPRFTGPRTYARLPWVKEFDGVDAAVYGLPWDGGTSFRTGARFGPEAIR